MIDNTKNKKEKPLKTLKERKHKQLDLFIADNFSVSSFRDEMVSMEHPFFALKSGDNRKKTYINGNITVTAQGLSDIGIATIFDKDIWIYAISKIQQALFENKPISPTIQFTVYDFLVNTNRDTGGANYKNFVTALDRLKGTVIKQNIKYSEDEEEDKGFGLIDEYKAVKIKKGTQEITEVKITLPNWLFMQITNNRVLKISSDYFRIRKAIDRRIYEIARKHCGNQVEFKISLEQLHMKTGSTASLREFKRMFKKLAETNDLPDYEIFYDIEKDLVIFKNRDPNAQIKYEQAKKNIAEKRTRETVKDVINDCVRLTKIK